MKPALRRLAGEVLARHCADPAVRQRMSEASKAAWVARDGLTPEQRASVALFCRKGFSRAEALRLLGLEEVGPGLKRSLRTAP